MTPTEILPQLGIKKNNQGASTGKRWLQSTGRILRVVSPVDGKLLATVQTADRKIVDRVIAQAAKAFVEWRQWPAPKRGDIVRQLGEALRKVKPELGMLVSYEMGKSYQEGLGEVQEMIDICDFASGLSRQLYGLTMQSERARHRMFEQYHPLGIVGIITAFNFPVAVWSWNSMIAWVCGDVCVWKPSEKAPLCGIACQKIVNDVFTRNGVPEGVSGVVNGDKRVGAWLAASDDIPLVSATGSVGMGRSVGEMVSRRLGRSLLELGGNNAMIITEHADLDGALNAAIFGAIGTAGQRCTTTRRLIVHERIYPTVKERLQKAYARLIIGSPLDKGVHVGPLIDRRAVRIYLDALEQIRREGGTFIVRGGALRGKGFESGCYVRPVVAEVRKESRMAQVETFAPILYVIRYKSLDEAIAIQNSVRQGLSSSMMTLNIRDMEHFLSYAGSDCGIANINVGTSGAEIGGAFGGEKDTGGGRESGSDAWKVYMRRQTTTINYSEDLPLAQGIEFKV